jgi:elongation factor Ts
MAEITAGMVKDLREMTGVGMMDCKAALAATSGDMEAAVDWLRAKGLAKAAKKSGRVAAEGLVGVSVSGTKGAAVEVNSETDFVARNEKFQAMVAEISKLAVEANGDLEKLKTAHYPGSEHSVAIFVAEMVATIGENMTVRRTTALSVNDGVIASYIHNQAAPGMGKIGVLVALESTGNKDELNNFGRLLAMHIAATNPVALTLESIPADVLAREKAVLEEKNAGKPANVMEKIVASGLKTYAKEFCLMDQIYVHDGTKSVTQTVGELSSKLGTPVAVKAFVRMLIGEGIEKNTGDFAAEVAKMSGT